jgi:organic hydroperoxide reductase OsmC/OhrA
MGARGVVAPQGQVLSRVSVAFRRRSEAQGFGLDGPDGYSDKVRLNPENLFVATVASAHMLSWLHIAFSMGAEIDTYVDAAEGVMTELEGGEYWISELILVPKITFIAGYNVTPAAIAHIHELAQKDSFIAHSIKTKVTVRAA